MTTNGKAKFRGLKELVTLLFLAAACSGDTNRGVVDELSSNLKTSAKSSRQGSSVCQGMGKYGANNLINAINNERKKRGLSVIPASNDMCMTALFKGLVDQASNDWSSTYEVEHGWVKKGVREVLNMKRRSKWKLPIKLTSSWGDKGGYRKPDEIFGRSLKGDCYGCPQSSTGFEISHGGEYIGLGVCEKPKDLVKNAMRTWRKTDHRQVILNQGKYREYNWKGLGAATLTLCEKKGTRNERFRYWTNAWFSQMR